MNRLILITISVITTILVFAVLYALNNDTNTSSEKITTVISNADMETSYKVNYELKQILSEHGITMSSPIKIDDLRSIWTYCNFFKGQEQKLVEHCTSTELLDSNDEFLGNIHMVGSSDDPKLLIVIIQIDPFLNKKQDAKIVFSTVIDNIVCKCWFIKKIQDSTLDTLVDRHVEFHISGGKITSKSNIIMLEDKSIQFEMTTNTEGYLWKLFVTV